MDYKIYRHNSIEFDLSVLYYQKAVQISLPYV